MSAGRSTSFPEHLNRRRCSAGVMASSPLDVDAEKLGEKEM